MKIKSRQRPTLRWREMDSNPRSPARETTLRDCLLIEEVRFAADSLLEGAGFEPSVPRLGVSSVVAPTTPTGPKGAPARRGRCEIALASSPTSGLAADLVHTNSAQDRLLRCSASSCSAFCRVTSNMPQLFVRGLSISKAPLQASTSSSSTATSDFLHRQWLRRARNDPQTRRGSQMASQVAVGEADRQIRLCSLLG